MIDIPEEINTVLSWKLIHLYTDSSDYNFYQHKAKKATVVKRGVQDLILILNFIIHEPS